MLTLFNGSFAMFDAASFTAPSEPLVLGNSAHPVAKYVKSLLLRKVPGKMGLYMVELNNSIMVTYRKRDKSFVYTDMTKVELRHACENMLPLAKHSDNMVSCEETDKWPGNALMRLLAMQGDVL